MEIQKRCKYCGRSFIAHKMTTIYCSPSCNNKDYKRAIRQKQIAEYMEEEKQKTPKVDILGGKEFLTPTEGALLLGLSRATFYRYMLNGTIKAVQLRGKTIVRRKDIERLFDNPPTYQSHSEKKQNVEEDVRRECKESVGFLEELEAMWEIITTRKLAGAFYVVFFVLLMSLELFVVVSKMVDCECDYEAAIKGAQKVRIVQFANAFNRVTLQKVRVV